MQYTILSVFFLFFLSIASCSDDEVFVEPEPEAVEETTGETEGNTNTDNEDVVPDVVNTGSPCEFSLAEAAPNSTVIINCVMDLEGRTVNIPDGVTVVNEGGSIINGTLNFTNNTTIDSALLNNTITLGNGTPILKDNVFEFAPERWGIVEGEVAEDIAQRNKEILQGTIDLAKSIGVNVFVIGRMDAFFRVGLRHGGQKGLSEDAIHLPSDFELRMGDDTFLRVQSTNFPWGVLLSTFEVQNVVVSGGNLIGDRFTHDYSDFIDGDGISRRSHEWPGLIITAGSENITFDGITMRNSTGDGFIAGAAAHRTIPGTRFNRNITLQNCILDANRRNNISLTDGEDIKILNNEITNAGSGESRRNADGSPIYDSNGVEPKYGLDVEPFITYSSFNIESETRFEWVQDVVIEGNQFIDNVNGSIIVFTGDNVLINNNFSDHTIALRETRNSDITNNTIEGNNRWGRAAISTSDFRRFVDFIGGRIEQYAVGNDVLNNTINGGFSTGLRINGSEAVVSGNEVNNVGLSIQVDRAETTEIYNNRYTSTTANSTGLILSSFADNINIHDEYFDVAARFLFVKDLNVDEKFAAEVATFRSNISNCTLKGGKTALIENTIGLTLDNNDIDTGTIVKNSQEINFTGNTVIPPFVDGLVVDGSSNVTATGNSFTLTNDNYDNIVVANNPPNANNTLQE